MNSFPIAPFGSRGFPHPQLLPSPFVHPRVLPSSFPEIGNLLFQSWAIPSLLRSRWCGIILSSQKVDAERNETTQISKPTHFADGCGAFLFVFVVTFPFTCPFLKYVHTHWMIQVKHDRRVLPVAYEQRYDYIFEIYTARMRWRVNQL